MAFVDDRIENQYIFEEYRFALLREQAQLQQTIARLTDECWDKCMGTPGGVPESGAAACSIWSEHGAECLSEGVCSACMGLYR